MSSELKIRQMAEVPLYEALLSMMIKDILDNVIGLEYRDFFVQIQMAKRL